MEKAVLISDVHYNVGNLPLSNASMRLALSKAESLDVPLIVAGDLLDQKAIVRGECANALITLLSAAKTKVIILVGNHCMINHHGKEHSLNFLRPYAQVVDSTTYIKELNLWFIPYIHNSEELKKELAKIPSGSTLITHNGLMGAEMGHYVLDQSSLPKECYAEFRTISGHYHKRQDIKCGRPRKGAIGLFSYLGSPFTMTFGEANDGPKGFSVLMDDGLLEFVPTNLRRHVIVELTTDDPRFWSYAAPKPQDLFWLKITGPKSELRDFNKAKIADLIKRQDFKLDLIPTDSDTPTAKTENMTDGEILDSLIDTLGEPDTQKSFLKSLWRGLVE